MIFAPGTGTITATTLETQFFTLCSLIQNIERDAAKNDKAVNQLTYTKETTTILKYIGEVKTHIQKALN